MKTLDVFVAKLVRLVASGKHTNGAAERSTIPGTFATAGISVARHRALTLVEVSISLTLLALVAASTTWTLSQMNFSATSSRLYTCAQTIAQNQIDAFLSAQPYSPSHISDDGTAYPRAASALVPPELVPGTATSTVTIYTDPAAGGTLTINGTLTRTVADLGLTQTTNGKTDNLDVRRLSVTLDYSFRGTAYQVALSTMRTSDFER